MAGVLLRSLQGRHPQAYSCCYRWLIACVKHHPEAVPQRALQRLDRARGLTRIISIIDYCVTFVQHILRCNSRALCYKVHCVCCASMLMARTLGRCSCKLRNCCGCAVRIYCCSSMLNRTRGWGSLQLPALIDHLIVYLYVTSCYTSTCLGAQRAAHTVRMRMHPRGAPRELDRLCDRSCPRSMHLSAAGTSLYASGKRCTDEQLPHMYRRLLEGCGSDSMLPIYVLSFLSFRTNQLPRP